jgi:hypothetical protein
MLNTFQVRFLLMTSTSHTYLTQLRILFTTHFSLAELQTFCFDLGIDYESIPAQAKEAWVRELLTKVARQGRLAELVALAQQEIPQVHWPTVPPDLLLPQSLPAEPEPSAPVVQTVHHYHGDVVGGDKVGKDKVGGDKISIGSMSGQNQGIAIGRGAQAQVTIQQGAAAAELAPLFAPLLAAVARENNTAVSHVQALQAEVAKGEQADDEKMADLIGEIADATPAVVEMLINLFSNSLIAKVAGAGTKQALKWLRRQYG